MIYAIDGTGPWSISAYKADMDRGFCRRITKRNAAYVYLRGPTNLGLETFVFAECLKNGILGHLNKGLLPSAINLMGHSRGGAAVIATAHMLKDEKIAVNSLLLFDAVDRTLAVSYQWNSIPSNVKRCLHFVRSEPFSNLFHHTAEYKQLLATVAANRNKTGKIREEIYGSNPLLTPDEQALWEFDICHRALRDACRFEVAALGGASFGNVGLKAEPGAALVIVPIAATHGALGGAPLDVSDYIPYKKHQGIVRFAERQAMIRIESMANSFLRLIGE